MRSLPILVNLVEAHRKADEVDAASQEQVSSSTLEV